MTAVLVPRTQLPQQPSRLSTLWMLYFMVLVAVPLAVIANWRRDVIQEHTAARRQVELGGWTDGEECQEYKLKCLLPPKNDYFRITSHGSAYPRGAKDPVLVTQEVVGLVTRLPNLRRLHLWGEKQADVNFAPLKRQESAAGGAQSRAAPSEIEKHGRHFGRLDSFGCAPKSATTRFA